MRRKGTSEQLAFVRERGLALLEKGKKPKEVAETLNITVRNVYRWRQESKKPKRKKTGSPLGRPRKIKEKQVKRLRRHWRKVQKRSGTLATTGHLTELPR